MSERLDRVENILVEIAERSQKTEAIANSNASAVEAMLQRMTMDREEQNAVLEVIAKQQNN
ncbi:hypothetical protein TUMEXPCC7403_09340 [Tumidithrix helvetica PCC 7403]|uniref:hypothetical protein n=1 Tax=Tumidithrix helvetica TaxID=3457545 RepID=UPI003C94DA36